MVKTRLQINASNNSFWHWWWRGMEFMAGSPVVSVSPQRFEVPWHRDRGGGYHEESRDGG